MQTFTIKESSRANHMIGLDLAVLRIESRGQSFAIPWESIRGVGLAWGGHTGRGTNLLIGYDAPGRSLLLRVADPRAPEIGALAAALQLRRPGSWIGVGHLWAMNRRMGLSNRNSYLVFGMNLVIVGVIVAALLALSAS